MKKEKHVGSSLYANAFPSSFFYTFVTYSKDYEEEDEDRYGPEEEWQWGVSYETLKSRIALMVESAFMAADNIQGVSMTATPEQEQ
eukprot:6393281-Pyramimonas_sp.AAC.1